MPTPRVVIPATRTRRTTTITTTMTTSTTTGTGAMKGWTPVTDLVLITTINTPAA